jgi:hypothetical protein
VSPRRLLLVALLSVACERKPYCYPAEDCAGQEQNRERTFLACMSAIKSGAQQTGENQDYEDFVKECRHSADAIWCKRIRVCS